MPKRHCTTNIHFSVGWRIFTWLRSNVAQTRKKRFRRIKWPWSNSPLAKRTTKDQKLNLLSFDIGYTDLFFATAPSASSTSKSRNTALSSVSIISGLSKMIKLFLLSRHHSRQKGSYPHLLFNFYHWPVNYDFEINKKEKLPNYWTTATIGAHSVQWLLYFNWWWLLSAKQEVTKSKGHKK